MESVTQEKKKLRSVICFEAQAPSGYTFIPAGNPQLTTACKEKCRAEGLQIHAVSHVHRIGYHFPSTVVASVCSELGLYLTSTGKTMPLFGMGRTEIRSRAGSEISQIRLNTDARDAIRDLFPNIPDQDLNQIIKTAFQKGQKKVGTATELPLARRAQLAVVAHVRHVYTDYDRLLKTTSFHEARTTVEHPTLAKVIEWRGDDENGQTVLEDVFREVIVISDDEDSESEEDAASVASHQNSSVVELLPTEARTHEIRTQPINTNPGQGYPRDPSEEAPPGFRFVTRVPANNSTNRRGFSRYQAWNRAIKEYREGIQNTEQPRFTGALAEKQSPRYAEKRIALDTNTSRYQDATETHRRVIPGSASMDNQAQRMSAIPLMDRSVAQRHVGVQDTHSDIQKTSSHNFSSRKPGLTRQESPELQILEELSGPRNMNMPYSNLPPMGKDLRPERLPPQSENRSNAPVFVSGPTEKIQNNVVPLGRRPGAVNSPLVRPGSNTQESVVPSIEASWPQETRRTDPAYPLVHMANQMSLRSVTPGRPQGELKHHSDVVEIDGNGDPPSKKRRMGREGSRVDPRPDPRMARPIGFPVSEGYVPRDSYRRAENAPEHRPQDQLQFRRDIVPDLIHALAGHRSLVLRMESRVLVSFSPRSAPQLFISLALGTPPLTIGIHIMTVIPAWIAPMSSVAFDDPAWMLVLFQRTRKKEACTRTDSSDLLITVSPPSFEFSFRRLAPETKLKPIGDASQSRNRERDPKYLATKNMSQVQVDPRGQLPARSVHPEHHRTFSDSVPKNQPHASPPQVPRERPSSGGFISRPLYYPPQEQNRPVYVQTVEPRTERQPFYPIPDGRHFVTVD
ncbi:uncharacterized protein N7506_008018 [Penicillium brevicompactum]|uniref:uncharacterized protein n=1 Tax=Penicillium brevicompactum TaxID=5074 RepID=UPI0025410C77|nr:uncharacterized protein N7506_008018 [Penicillium brevicompactum]KAJ5334235.1 hypothetical protein N7506_008018 [Penicillium brevicompactum]